MPKITNPTQTTTSFSILVKAEPIATKHVVAEQRTLPFRTRPAVTNNHFLTNTNTNRNSMTLTNGAHSIANYSSFRSAENRCSFLMQPRNRLSSTSTNYNTTTSHAEDRFKHYSLRARPTMMKTSITMPAISSTKHLGSLSNAKCSFSSYAIR